MKFDFSKSREDLQNKSQFDKLDIMSGNILYITHEIDKVLKIVRKLEHDVNLQKQVDEFFEDSPQQELEDK